MRAKIFINYRREDSKGEALALSQMLALRLRNSEIFMDVAGGIQGGENFIQVLEQSVANASLLLCLIGEKWLDLRGADGSRRLSNPRDFVRIEILSAMRREIPIIPVLIDETRMPGEAELPAEMSLLASKQAMRLRHERFATDADGLIEAIEKLTGMARRKPLRLPVAAVAVLCLAAGAGLGHLLRGGETADPVGQFNLQRMYINANDFLTASNETSFASALERATSEVWMIASSLHITADTYHELLLRKLNEGVDINVLVLDPDSPALLPTARTFNVPLDEMRSYCESSLKTLERLRTRLEQSQSSDSGKLQIRLSSQQILMRSYFFDPLGHAGFTYFIPQSNSANSQTLPGFYIKNGAGIVHVQYFSSIVQFWNSDMVVSLEKWKQVRSATR